jgi:predicted HAD superfamily Cof-like phosphohydrolase
MPLDKTYDWFEKAVPKITASSQKVQLGVHFEEFGEMLDAIEMPKQKELLDKVNAELKLLANALKKDPKTTVIVKDRAEFLDAMVDQQVTATGVSYMFGLNCIGGLDAVNASNFSKFKDGYAIFDANGKIAKNPETYFKADLSPFVGVDPVA